MTDHLPPPIELPGTLLYRVLYGSHAHATNTPASDEDWRGVYLLPNDHFLGLDRAKTTFEDKTHDQVFWELGHFCQLLLKGNPNIVGMLFAPSDVVDTIDTPFHPLINDAWRFVHAGTISAYMGWVHRELADIAKLHKGSAKRLSHIPRLLWEIESAIETGAIAVRPSIERRSVILAIKQGQMAYDDAVAFCGSLLLDVEQMVEKHGPFLDPPREWLSDYLLTTREAWGR